MRDKRDLALFAGAWVALSLALGWLFWSTSSAQLDLAMLAVPVMSAMLAAVGFSWKRKLVYTAASFGLYLLGSAVADAAGLVELAGRQLNEYAGFPTLGVILYVAYLTTFPLAMLVLFVGRSPARLWSRAAPKPPAGKKRRT